MQQPLLVRILVAAASAVALLAGYLWLNAGPSTRVVAMGEPIQQDDFFYIVAGVSKAKSIGSGETVALAHGVFYVATIEVANKALRVDYRWDPSIVYVIDADGRKYQMSVEGQRALDAAHRQILIIPAGGSQSYQVAFDLPDRADHPALAFSNGILMGDLFDGAAYMKARVPLE
jgi:hypothetical protein